MICSIPDFCEEAVNVYRTKKYIVKQDISVEMTDSGDTIIFSNDVFYERTKIRDKQYEHIFAERKNVNGKRLPSTSYTRRYIK